MIYGKDLQSHKMILNRNTKQTHWAHSLDQESVRNTSGTTLIKNLLLRHKCAAPVCVSDESKQNKENKVRSYKWQHAFQICPSRGSVVPVRVHFICYWLALFG